jgi:hypothetical protein
MADDDASDLIAGARAAWGVNRQSRVLQGLSGDKDKAAHSIELGNETGLDPESIYGNYDAAVPQMKSQAAQVLTDDPLLKSYIDSHALASTVSKDDWGPLSEFSNKLRDSMTLFRPKPDAPTLEQPRALNDIRPRELWDAAQRIADAFMSPYAERSGISEEDLLKLHVPANIARDNMLLPWYLSLIDPLQTAVRIDAVMAKGPMALIYGISQAAGEARDLLFPGAEGEGQRFSRHLAEFAQVAPFAMGFGAHELPSITGAVTETMRKRMGRDTVAEMKAKAQVKEVEGLLKSWAPFVLSGEDPPMGLDPKTDAMKADAAKEVSDKMKEVMQAADKSETKQKAPELFQSLVANGTEHEAGLTWKAVSKLYGDKVPEPGDGMLGDIPGIAEQFEKSRADGSDITIPQDVLLSRVDKDTVKTLWDNIRWRATDPTTEESKAPTIKLPTIEVGEEPVEKSLEDHLTTAAGLDPLATPEGVPLFGETEQRMQKLYNMLMEKIQDRKTARQLKRLRAIEASRKTDEWKENWSNTRADVAEDIKASPFIRAHDFFQNSKYNGVELAEKPKIDPKYLTPEQRAKLPRRFMKEGGLDPDAIAGEFGYPTGEHLIQELIGFTEARGEIGPKAFIDRMIDAETSRIMEMRYGDLPKDILDRTRSQLLMTERRDQLHLEYRALASKVGKKAKSRGEIENWAEGAFTKSDARKANYPEILRELGRSGRDAQKAFQEGDLAEAYRQKEQQVHLYAQAELVKEFNVTQRRLQGALKRLNKREPEGLSQQVRDIVHTVLYKIGETPRRSLANVQESLSLQTFKTAKEFQDHWNQQNKPVGYEEYNQLHNPYIAIPDFVLAAEEWDKKTLSKATVGEVRAINNALQSLIKHGEGERIVRTLTTEYKLDDLIDNKLVPLIKKAGPEMPLGPPPKEGTWADKVSRAQRMQATLIQMDYLWNFLSGFDETGIFNRVLTHEFGRAGNEHRALQKKYGKIIERLSKEEGNFNKPIANNVFKYMERLPDGSLRVHPRNEFIPMTEGHLLAIMLNMGTNFDNLAAGFKVTKQQIQTMVDATATKRHWRLTQGFWSLLKDLQTEEDRTTMQMNGTTVDRVPTTRLMTGGKGSVGEIEGGYFPLSYDREMGSIPGADLKKSPIPVIKEQTNTGWHVPRTGYVGPLNLTLSDLGQSIDRRLRAIAFNPVLHEMSKVLRDPRIVSAIRDHVGKQYADLIPQYINDIAGQHDFPSKNMAVWDRFFEKLRVRTINYLIGWNPGTWALHIPTATLQSIGDIGLIPFIKAATYDLWKTNEHTGESNWKFIHEGGVIGNHISTGAKEIQGRTHHFIELPEGQIKRLMEGGRSFEEISGKWGATPIAWTDKIVSTITYMAKYKQVMAENIGKMPVEQAHILADDVASSTVRRTHGSTLITSKAEILRQGNPVFKNLFSLYNFMNNIHNRQWEMVKASGKALRGEAGVEDYKTIGRGAFFYILVPTAIEEMVNPFCGEKDSNLKCMGKFMAVGATSGIGTARDIVHGVITGHETGGGVTTAFYKDLSKVASHIGDPSKLKHDFGEIVADIGTGLALAKGWGSRELNTRWAKLLTNAITGKERAARNPEEALRQFRYGTKEVPKGPQVKSRILQLVTGKHR